ncbi:MAG: hypothetical protein AB1403_17060 [Candidatus Riflebacteria bacterium]
MKRIILVFLAVLIACASNGAEKLKKITLKDASVIIGSVIEMKEGRYTVETKALGRLVLDEDKIVEIRSLTAAEETAEEAENQNQPLPTKKIKIKDGSKKKKQPAVKKYEEQVESYNSGSDDLNRQQEEVNSRVKSMTADGGFLNSLMDLSQNGNMMDVMSDPEVMDAISRNDYDFLMNNEKMKTLMESSEIKDMLGDVEP